MSSQAPSSEAARLLTAHDVAERWQVPASQVYRLAREGKLAAVEIGRYRRFTIESIEAFERGNGV
jgi:excisionase family DNA binding protein